MADIDLSSFKGLYFQTAKEYLTTLEHAAQVLSKESTNDQAINDSFIASHSLKSQSSVMGFIEVSLLSGVLEKVFRSFKEKEKTVTPEILAIIFEAISSLRTSMTLLESEEKETDLHEVRDRLRKIGLGETV